MDIPTGDGWKKPAQAANTLSAPVFCIPAECAERLFFMREFKGKNRLAVVFDAAKIVVPLLNDFGTVCFDDAHDASQEPVRNLG